MHTQYIQLNVPLNFTQVVDIVRQLSASEKQQFTEILCTETVIGDIVVPEEHKRLVMERIKKYENSPVSYFSWDDIESKMATHK